MIVYASHLSILPSAQMEDVLIPIAKWLSNKTRSTIKAEHLITSGRRQYPSKVYLDIATRESGAEVLTAIRFSHPDKTVVGRTWFTEIGLSKQKGSFGCSFLLRTEEKSALVADQVQTTRPILVQMLADECPLLATTPGGSARALTTDDAEAFEYEISNPDRDCPIVQVSCYQGGDYSVDPSRLASFLIGVADVVSIGPDVDTFALERALGPRYSCFHGAVNVIWPVVGAPATRFAPATRILPSTLLEWRSVDLAAENEVLATICHRTNGRNSRRHLTVEAVHSAVLRDSISAATAKGSTVDLELAALVKQVDEEQQGEIRSLKLALEKQDQVRDELQDGIDYRDATIESLKASLSSLSESAREENSDRLTEGDRSTIVEALTDEPTLEHSLRLLEIFFPDRVLVLDSARKSARAAEGFQKGRQALALLFKLCGEYVDALIAGKSDAEARGIFGNAFSAKESETVENNRKARMLRTFTHKGGDLEMMMHLKIGNKPSIHETWRCHFKWDSDDKRIVIGHCGKHLDHG